MRIPYFIKGAFFGPAFIALVMLLKAFCPDSAGDGCLANHFAVPIFLPLVFIYKFLGTSSLPYEFAFIIAYWAIVGALVGLIFDLYKRQSQYSREQRLPPSRTSGPGFPPQSRA